MLADKGSALLCKAKKSNGKINTFFAIISGISPLTTKFGFLGSVSIT